MGTLTLPCAVVLCLTLISGAHGYTDNAEDDRVTDLPGWGYLRDFNMFSGYITLDAHAGRNMFYVFVEAEHDPRDAPVVLWLNGGPGCSSLGGGFMSELGPWFPTPEGQLEKDPHSWNHFANVLFIESPVGVGFSYSERHEDYTTNDATTAADSYQFLVRFFERFPEYADNEFVIAGESYAGHYVPQLALEIVKHNRADSAAGNKDGKLVNLVGFLVGNPSTFHAIDTCGAVDFWWSHALVSDEGLAGMKEHCGFCGAKKADDGDGGVEDEDPDTYKECNSYVDKVQEEMGRINPYNIYADLCVEVKRSGPQRRLAKILAGHPAGLTARVAVAAVDRVREARLSRVRGTGGAATSAVRQLVTADEGAARDMAAPGGERGSGSAGGTASLTRGGDPPYDPCVSDEVEWYLNRPEVQRALHANQSHEARRNLPGRWTDCSDVVEYSRHDTVQSQIPFYKELLNADLEMLVYSGDVDGIVPVIGTRRWIAELGLKVREPWQSWTDARGQVGGYIVHYAGISFATVRNAGHMVPYTQPERMYHLAKKFLRRAK